MRRVDPLHLDLLSSPPTNKDIKEIFIESTCLKANPTVVYLPAAILPQQPSPKSLRQAQRLFGQRVKLISIGQGRYSKGSVEHVLDSASLLYIPGGNTYLLSHLLHQYKLDPLIRNKVRTGLPLFAFSAGAVFCGPNILTTNDINCCGCREFSGLALGRYNLNVHYPKGTRDRRIRDSRLRQYQVFHENPILALEDGTHVKVHGSRLLVVKGLCWLLRKSKPSQRIRAGSILPV